MSINTPFSAETYRQPRLRVLSQGQPIGGALGWEVQTHNYFQAATWRADFALGADPNFGANWWGTQKPPVKVDLQASLDDGNSWKSMLFGVVDHMTLDPIQGVISVDGRDMSALLIDQKTREAFQNKTSSQIATELAARHQLTPDVQATTTLVGRYYSAEHVRIVLNSFSRVTTEWDLLCNLAQHEQFLCWVTGNTLHFKPGPTLNDNPWDVVLSPGNPARANVTSLTMERAMTMAKDVVVVVRSWSSRNGKGCTAYSPSAQAEADVASGEAQEFAFIIPNLTPAQAQAKANQLREDITRHERLVTFQAPADLILTAQNVVRVQGTGSSWDQAYYVDWVRRRIGWRSGFTMTVHAKNHSPATQSASP